MSSELKMPKEIISKIRPVVSILTCVLNAKQDFERTAYCLPVQLPVGFEWIVVDGGSTDGTLELISADPRCTLWVSQPDRGVYDAYNKALGLAQGDYVWYLNAGDWADLSTLMGLVAHAAAALDSQHPQVLCYQVFMEAHGKVWSPEPDLLTDHMSVPTPGVLLPRRALLEMQGFNSGLRIAADYEVLLKLKLMPAVQFTCVSKVLTHYKGDGLSTKLRHLGMLEECGIQARHLPEQVDSVLLKIVRHAVFNISIPKVRFSRWRVALTLARRLLY